MGIEFKAKVFRNGRSRLLELPDDIELPGEEVVLRQQGRRVVIEPKREQPERSLGEWLATLEPLPPDDRFEPIEDYPTDPVDP